MAPLSCVRWLTPSPSTSPPRHLLRPAPRRASAAATTGCSPAWRPSPSSAGRLRAHQPALLVLLFVLPLAKPLLQLLRAAAPRGAPLLRPLVDSEPINQPSSSSSSSCPSPSHCCSYYGLQPPVAPLSCVSWLTPSPSTSPPHRPVRLRASAAAATGCSQPWRPSPSSAG